MANSFSEIYSANLETIQKATSPEFSKWDQTATSTSPNNTPSTGRTNNEDKSNTPTIDPLLLEHIKGELHEGEGFGSLLGRVSLGLATRDASGNLTIVSATIYNSAEQKERLSNPGVIRVDVTGFTERTRNKA